MAQAGAARSVRGEKPSNGLPPGHVACGALRRRTESRAGLWTPAQRPQDTRVPGGAQRDSARVSSNNNLRIRAMAPGRTLAVVPGNPREKVFNPRSGRAGLVLSHAGMPSRPNAWPPVDLGLVGSGNAVDAPRNIGRIPPVTGLERTGWALGYRSGHSGTGLEIEALPRIHPHGRGAAIHGGRSGKGNAGKRAAADRSVEFPGTPGFARAFAQGSLAIGEARSPDDPLARNRPTFCIPLQQHVLALPWAADKTWDRACMAISPVPPSAWKKPPAGLFTPACMRHEDAYAVHPYSDDAPPLVWAGAARRACPQPWRTS